MNLKEIAEKRQKKRQETWIYTVKEDDKKPKYYVLDMFPYPSGAGLHVWHPKGYIASDCVARKKMLQWYSVLHPMGFDTFWLWTENYAIEHKMKPQVVAKQNIDNYIRQLEMFGTTYDWNRSVSTADPEYFKRTQRIFLQLYTHYYDEKLKKAMPITDPKTQQRLAYVDYKPINWCPKCKTGLANEDLDDGKCERCGSDVEQKPMRQRVLRITAYAQRLIDGLDDLDREENMKDLERNWIGKSEGTQFKMEILTENHPTLNPSPLHGEGNLFFEVYTTRIDTVFGMSFVVMAPEHELVDQITTDAYKKQVEEYKDAAKHKTQLERTELQKDKNGQFTGTYAINPFNGQKVPVYIADYVLANYGTGVVMAVPAHDERDFEFAKKHDLPIMQSVMPIDQLPHTEAERRHTISAVVHRSTDNKFLFLKWKKFEWVSPVVGWIEWNEDIFVAAEREVLEETWYTVKAIKKIWRLSESNFFADNKNVRRQRIDQPILLELVDEKPIAVAADELEKHEVVWLTYEEAVEQTTHKDNLLGLSAFVKWEAAFCDYGRVVNSWTFTWLTSEEAIVAMQKWLEEKHIWWKKVQYKIQDRVFSRQRYWWEPFPIVFCDKCGIVPLDEKDLPLLLPDVENYEPTGTEEGPLAAIDDWMNVKCPTCGGPARRESNTMPGWAWSSRYRLRYMDPKNDKALVSKETEAYRKNVDVYVWGAEHVTRHMIYARFWQKFLFDIWVVTQQEPFKEYHSVGLIMWEDGRKMSKRRWNVVNPDDVIAEHGTDTLRTYEMFMGPFEQSIAWSTSGISGVKKFLEKIIKLQEKISSDCADTEETLLVLHQTIKKLTEQIDDFKFNTSVAQMMILVNHLTDQKSISKQTFESLVILVAPFAPHLAEELWEQLWNSYSIFTQARRPIYDEKYLVANKIKIGVQFNGKVRWDIIISPETSQEEVINLVKTDEKLKTYLTGEPKKIVYIQGKILNIVL